MNTETFNKHLDMLQKLEKEILLEKAKHYAHGDRLSNFHAAGSFNNVRATTALWDMVTKHIIALRDFVHEVEYNDYMTSPEQWFEKLGDIRNYMYLLSALLYDLNPEYKEMFDDRTKHLREVQTQPATQSSRKRRG